MLEKRVSEIEKVIDDHLIFLHGEPNLIRHFEYDATDPVTGEKFRAHVPYSEKLSYLLKQQNYFGCTNPDHAVRPETLRMRMQTITQSYQMLDSALYIKMKPIAEALEDEPEWQLSTKLPESNTRQLRKSQRGNRP